MNKFMGGLTLGIIATSCFFIFYNPFQKKATIQEAPFIENEMDSLPVPGKTTGGDTLIFRDSTFSNNVNINRDSLVWFAKSFLGTPYLYGSSDPSKGFDCSGFINYVFNHFKFSVPRSSTGFEHMGTKRAINSCRPGDVILFTGTNPQELGIGHIGIICDTSNVYPSFVHSTSGKANGVTISSMDNKFYQERFISVIDLFSKN